MLSLDHFGLTDAGKVRENNEDSLLSGSGRDPALFAVADGIGGFEAGEVASSMVIELLEDLRPGDSLEDAIRESNDRIHAAAKKDEKLSGMGTTVVAARLSETESGIEAEISHVGDSRAYRIRDGKLEPLTEDHSLVAELVRSGSLTRAQASEHPQKNLITRALGAEESVEVETARHSLRRGDRLVLCSDGLQDMVSETRISEQVAGRSAGNAEESARELVSEALSAGGSDNVTVVVVDVKGSGQPETAQGSPASAPSAPPASPEPEAESTGTTDSEEAARPSGGRGGRRLRRKSRSRKGGEGEARESSARSGSYASLREGESLIPGVWDGDRAVIEEGPEPEPTPEEVVERYRVRPVPETTEARESHKRRRRRKRLAQGGKAISALIRGLAVIALLGILLVPPYLWWSTRYFMAYDDKEVVIYQGVPYDFLGNELNRVDQRTGVQRSDIAEPYRDQVSNNQLYTQDRLQTVLEDLQEN